MYPFLAKVTIFNLIYLESKDLFCIIILKMVFHKFELPRRTTIGNNINVGKYVGMEILWEP